MADIDNLIRYLNQEAEAQEDYARRAGDMDAYTNAARARAKATRLEHMAETAVQLRAECDRLAAENAALADRLVDAQTLNTSLLRLSRKLQGRSQRRLARMRELEALLTDALGRMEKVFGTLEDEDVYMATVNRIRAALGEQVADESEEER